LIKEIEVKRLDKISLTQTFALFFKKICKYWIQFFFFLVIFVLQKTLNNETTYSNGESQLVFKVSINQYFIPLKCVVSCDNWIGGYCMIDSKRNGKSFKFMLTLESWIWKICEDPNRPLTY
jgi:hypothetical protein